MLIVFILLLVLCPFTCAVKCLDCVGKDCMGSFCEGDYCVLAQYAPRWGTIEWGKPQIVKGCMSGSLLRKDIRDHCEAADDEGKEKFTCFCNSRDNCNGGRTLQRLEVETVELLTCVCSGAHCKGETCLGELCSYVINHRTKETERGCVNASVPIVERRSMGSCMIPPITGAMHHTVAKEASDLLKTESCVCATDYCNAEKPQITVPERQKCQTFVTAKMSSKNVTCTGEFCFKARIKSKLGHMTEYNTMGCASFTGDDMLAEELNPTGCAKFDNEQLDILACFETKDKSAIGRARANQEVREPKRRPSKGKGRKPPPKMEIEYEEEEEGDDEDVDDDENENNKGGDVKTKEEKEETKEKEESQKPAKNGEKEEEETEEKDKEGDDGTDKDDDDSDEDTTPISKNFIFERPTQPPIPDDSNTTMIAVFVLIILCIVVSGAVWKFELHKKLFRSSYDSVAGG
ncbi:hypothetical protein V3C99_004658 [Haemonchus contortus]